MDDNEFTRQFVGGNLNRYFLEVENEERVRVHDVVKGEDYDRNIVFQMFKDDNEIKFTIDRDVVYPNLLPGKPTRITNIIGRMELNRAERVYLSEFSYRIEEPELGIGKDITFSYKRTVGGEGE